MSEKRGPIVKFMKNRIFSYLCGLLAVLTWVAPQVGLSGGEWSGEGILRPAGYQFPTLGAARTAFNSLQSGSEAYWESAFAKSIPEIRLHPDSPDRFVADSEVCIDGDHVRSVVPGPRSGEFLVVPLQYQVPECQRWMVDHKEHSLPRRFHSEAQASRWARDSSNARGEPYCRDEDWVMVTKRPTTSYVTHFYAEVRGKNELVEVGSFRYQLFRCDQLNQMALRNEIRYQDFVREDLNFHPEDWVQMAGGEFSGEGKRRNDR